MARLLRVALLDDYQRFNDQFSDWSALAGQMELTVFDVKLRDSELTTVLAPFDVLILIRERTAIPEAILDALPNLKLIITTGPRNAAIDLAAARRRGIPVCATRNSMTSTIEFSWALILAVTRHVCRRDAQLKRGGWDSFDQVGIGLNGRTLGVVGLGAIGREMARIAQAFGMHVVAWSSNLTEDDAAAAGATKVAKDELFRHADIVSIHLRLSDRTVGAVGSHELSLMKQTAFLVNTSRGKIIDEPALIESLRARRIGGAALDVFDREPLPSEHPLRSLDNVVLSPHAAGLTADHVREWFIDVAEDLQHWLAGTPLRVISP